MPEPSRLLPSSTVSPDKRRLGPVRVLAFDPRGLDALVATVEVLAQFEILVAPALLAVAVGETPDFGAFARQAAQDGIRVVIAATYQKRLARDLAVACQVPTIRIPLAEEASTRAGLAALMEEEAEIDLAVDAGSFATVALGEAGARNAALLAISILALRDERLAVAWRLFREQQTQTVLAQAPPGG